MKLYRLMLAGENEVVLPEPIEEQSTSRILTMRWVEGQKLLKYLEAEPSQEDRNKVAVNMFRTWYVPFYYYGVIHGLSLIHI